MEKKRLLSTVEKAGLLRCGTGWDGKPLAHQPLLGGGAAEERQGEGSS